MPGYHLKQLTEFNHALVYGFDPEGSPNALAESQKLEDTLYVNAAQHDDVLDAYLYAQDTILPVLKSGSLASLSSEQLLIWIKQIHQRIGKTLLGCYQVDSGQYAVSPVFRWHAGAMIQAPISLFLADLLRPRCTLDLFVSTVAAEYKIKVSDLMAFMELALKIQKDSSIVLTDSQRSGCALGQAHEKAATTLAKMQNYYYSDRCTPAERKVINKIVKICMPCEEYDEAMRSYCASQLSKLQQLNKEDLDEVSDFIAHAFYELVEIHPFPNCNGRTATCLINTLLRYLGHPSILFRHPGERDNPESLYFKIFESNEVDIALLKQHIKQRILEANEKPFSAPLLNALIDQRVHAMLWCKRIQKRHPSADLDQFFKTQVLNKTDYKQLTLVAEAQIESFVQHCQTEKDMETLMGLLVTQDFVTKLKVYGEELALAKAKSIDPTPANIHKKFAVVTQTAVGAWNSYNGGSIVLFESESQELVERTLKQLQKLNIGCTLSLTKRKDNGHPVIKIGHVNPIKLFLLVDAEQDELDDEHQSYLKASGF
jgi:prophage maintenance system killer protein